MVTKESLAEIGVKSYDKTISPNWYFIVMCFIFMNTLIYLIVGLFIWSYNISQGRDSAKSQSSNTLYYDKLREHDEDLNKRSFLNICCRCLYKKKENKVDAVQPEKKHEFAVSYKDMENLLDEFHACQALLKK